MSITLQCMTCGIVIGHLWLEYVKLAKEYEKDGKKDPLHQDKLARGLAMDTIGLKDTCCRQAMLSHIELAHKLRNRYQD